MCIPIVYVDGIATEKSDIICIQVGYIVLVHTCECEYVLYVRIYYIPVLVRMYKCTGGVQSVT